MIPVYQTVFTSTEGNCFAACIASVFEVSIDLVPSPTAAEMVDIDSWQPYERRLQDQFFGPRGFWAVSLAHREELTPPGYALLGVETRYGLHSVVCLDGEIIHDPFPGGLELGERRDWTLFVPLDPARCGR